MITFVLKMVNPYTAIVMVILPHWFVGCIHDHKIKSTQNIAKLHWLAHTCYTIVSLTRPKTEPRFIMNENAQGHNHIDPPLPHLTKSKIPHTTKFNTGSSCRGVAACGALCRMSVIVQVLIPRPCKNSKTKASTLGKSSSVKHLRFPYHLTPGVN